MLLNNVITHRPHSRPASIRLSCHVRRRDCSWGQLGRPPPAVHPTSCHRKIPPYGSAEPSLLHRFRRAVHVRDPRLPALHTALRPTPSCSGCRSQRWHEFSFTDICQRQGVYKDRLAYRMPPLQDRDPSQHSSCLPFRFNTRIRSLVSVPIHTIVRRETPLSSDTLSRRNGGLCL